MSHRMLHAYLCKQRNSAERNLSGICIKWSIEHNPYGFIHYIHRNPFGRRFTFVSSNRQHSTSHQISQPIFCRRTFLKYETRIADIWTALKYLSSRVSRFHASRSHSCSMCERQNRLSRTFLQNAQLMRAKHTQKKKKKKPSSHTSNFIILIKSAVRIASQIHTHPTEFSHIPTIYKSSC